MKKKTSKSAENKKKDKPEGYVFGRPSIYTPELGKRICDLIATNTYGLKKLCSMHDWMPAHNTIAQWRWLLPDFSTLYTKAKLLQAELMAEDCIDIADDSSNDIKLNSVGDEVCNTEFVNRARLRVDTRKWLASKLLPKVYGDKQQIEDLQAMNSELREEMNQLRKQLDAKNKKEF